MSNNIADNFNSRLAMANVGDRLIYYVGDIAHDRAFSFKVDALAQTAWLAFEKDRVLLFQKRVTQPGIMPAVFNYIAVKL